MYLEIKRQLVPSLVSEEGFMEVTVLYLDEAEDTQVRECEATEAVCAGGEI